MRCGGPYSNDKAERAPVFLTRRRSSQLECQISRSGTLIELWCYNEKETEQRREEETELLWKGNREEKRRRNRVLISFSFIIQRNMSSKVLDTGGGQKEYCK